MATDDAPAQHRHFPALAGHRGDNPRAPHRLRDGDFPRRPGQGPNPGRNGPTPELRPRGVPRRRGRRETDRRPHQSQPVRGAQEHPRALSTKWRRASSKRSPLG